MTTIGTDRLQLFPLPPGLVAALVEGDLDAARALAPVYDVTEGTFSKDGHTLRMRHEQLIADPAEEPWLYRVAVRRGSREVVGRVGFHSPPDDDGTVEIGYSTAVDHLRQGYALEMASALISWGAAHGARRCLASVRPDNTASLATIARLGFVRTGEQIDEIDGLEWVHTLKLRPGTLVAVGPAGSPGGFA